MERFIQTLPQECLDDFFVFGGRHMNYFVREMVAYYHESRAHQAKDNGLLVPAGGSEQTEGPDLVRLDGVRG